MMPNFRVRYLTNEMAVVSAGRISWVDDQYDDSTVCRCVSLYRRVAYHSRSVRSGRAMVIFVCVCGVRRETHGHKELYIGTK